MARPTLSSVQGDTGTFASILRQICCRAPPAWQLLACAVIRVGGGCRHAKLMATRLWAWSKHQVVSDCRSFRSIRALC